MARQGNSDRDTRREKVLNELLAREKFTVAQAKASFPDVFPASITMLVHRLERDGHVRKDDDGVFRWSVDPAEFSAQRLLKAKASGPAITETPAADRPRERLLTQGAASLRTAELLAILIRSGLPGESALQAGEKIAAGYADALDRLAKAGPGELKALSSAVGPAAYCQIMAAVELGRRVVNAAADRPQRPLRIQSSEDAAAFCRERFARLASDGVQEEFHVVCLDTKHQVLNTHKVSVGSLDRSLVHPREVFRPAIGDAAKAVLLVHNHPSGDPTPSDEDYIVTNRLEEAGKTLGIQVLDHVIVARNGVISIRVMRGGG